MRLAVVHKLPKNLAVRREKKLVGKIFASRKCHLKSASVLFLVMSSVQDNGSSI